MREEQELDYKGFIKTKRERWVFILSGAVKGFALWLYTTTVSVLWGEDGTEAGDPLGAYWNQDGVLDMQVGAGGGSVGFGDAEREACLPPQSPQLISSLISARNPIAQRLWVLEYYFNLWDQKREFTLGSLHTSLKGPPSISLPFSGSMVPTCDPPFYAVSLTHAIPSPWPTSSETFFLAL